jgi:hypothetical protein
MQKYSEHFREKHYAALNSIPDRHRGDGFLKIFEFLEITNLESPIILETGSMRPGFTMEGDGQSTLLFDEFVQTTPWGHLYTVDIDPRAAEFTAEKCSDRTTATCQDSVSFLWQWSMVPSVIYLDSFDVDFAHPHNANFHAMKELCAISRFLKYPPMLIAIDDCKFPRDFQWIPSHVDHRQVGKGYYVREFMENIGATMIHDDYQLIWTV